MSGAKLGNINERGGVFGSKTPLKTFQNEGLKEIKGSDNTHNPLV